MAGQWEGGKGDKDRVDMKKYRDNWDAIDWGKKSPREKEPLPEKQPNETEVSEED